MLSHLSATMIEQYRQRTLSAAELLAVDDHIAACQECRLQLAAAVPAATGVQATIAGPALAGEEAFHLPREQLAAYVDGQIEPVEREIAEGHLEYCGQCLDEVRDLRAFKALMTTHPAREHAPVAVPGLAEKLRGFLGKPALWLPLHTVAVAATAALVVWVLVRPSGSPLQDQRETVTQLQQANESLRLENESLQQRMASRPAPPVIPPPQPDTGAQPVVKPPTAPTPAPGEDRLVTNPPPRPAAPQLPAEVRAAVRLGRVKPPAMLASLIGERGQLMGSDASRDGTLQAQSPVGTAVLTDEPDFSWTPMSGATAYTVVIADSDGSEVARSGALPGTEWKLSQPLPRGQTYQWQIIALKDGQELFRAPVRPAPPARFKVLEARQAEELQRVRSGYETTLKPADAHLSLGVLYAGAGLMDDSEREFRRAMHLAPGSTAARKLLANVESIRRGKR